MTHRDRSEYKIDSSVMAVCKSVTIPGMTGHVRRNTHRELVAWSNYILVYQEDALTVRILRVLHAAQQWPPTD